MMITQQVVTYIKDQLARGTDRTKIRANLLSAGWVESDINQAFSFAEPVSQSATVKIAPAFAIEEEVKPKNPIDKTELVKEEPIMPVLQKDGDKKEPSNLSAFAYGNNAVNTEPSLNQNSLSSNPVILQTETKPAAPVLKPEVSLNNIVKTPISNPEPVQSAASSIRNTIETDVVRNFESVSGLAMNPALGTKTASPVLKIIAGLLFLFLIFGNIYLWAVVLPGMQKNEPINNQNNVSQLDQTTRVQETVAENIVESAVVKTENSLVLELNTPVSNLQKAASAYFSSYNSYGGSAMSLGSCSTSGTVFSDSLVKKSLEDISNITGRVPQCSLSSDTNSTNRTISYMVYVPMEDGGYCADSMGANMVVNKKPTGTSCSTGL